MTYGKGRESGTEKGKNEGTAAGRAEGTRDGRRQLAREIKAMSRTAATGEFVPAGASGQQAVLDDITTYVDDVLTE